MGIYRLSEGKVIAGICAGIADKYKIDVTLVRLAVVFLTIFTGFWPGVITYLVGWFLIPEIDQPQNPQS
ncbi:MAG: PspC domain-containing protein [Chitinispirillaceae bacterium]